MKSIISIIIGAAVVVTSLVTHAGGVYKQTVDIVGQSGAGPVVAERGATIVRTANGITARFSMPSCTRKFGRASYSIWPRSGALPASS